MNLSVHVCVYAWFVTALVVWCKSIGDQRETNRTEMAMRGEGGSLRVLSGKMSKFWPTVLAVCLHMFELARFQPACQFFHMLS